MSTPGTIAVRTPITGTNNPAFQVSKDAYNDSLVVASAAPDGAILIRDSAQTDGWGFADELALLTIRQDNLATTPADGLILSNATVTDGSHPSQTSPRLRLSAYGFDAWNGIPKTTDWTVDSLAAYNPVGFAAYATLRFGVKIASGSYSYPFALGSDGLATFTGEVVASQFTAAVLGGGNNKTRLVLSGTPSNGQLQITKFDQSAGIILDAASGVLKVYDQFGGSVVGIEAASLNITGSANSKIGVDNSLSSVASDLNGVSEPCDPALYLSHTSNTGAIILDQIGGVGLVGAGLVTRRCLGTAAAPTDVVDALQLGYMDFRAYSGTKFFQCVSIAASVDGTFTSGQAPPSRLIFATNSANSGSVERMRIDKNGYVYIGTSSQLVGLGSTPFTVKQGAAVANYTVAFKGSTSGLSYGLRIEAGSGSTDGPLWLYDQAGSTLLFSVKGDGSVTAKSVAITPAASASGLFVNVSTAGTAITNGLGLAIANVSATTNNYAAVLFTDAAAGAASVIVQAQFTNRTSHYGDFVVANRAADGFLERMRVSSVGLVTIMAAAAYAWTGRSSITAPADGQINLTNLALSAGVGFDVATDGTLKVRTRAQSAYATVDAIGYKVSGVAIDTEPAGFYNAGNSSTALTLDWNNARRQRLTLTGNVTFTLSNPVDGARYILHISTGAGSFTGAWPAAVLWSGGVAPVLTTAASKVDIVVLVYSSTTGKYYGAVSQNY